jgi:putative transposase
VDQHLIRNSLTIVSWKDRKAILPAIKAIYQAETADMALVRLEDFEDEWGKRYPAVGQAWRRTWDYVVPFFAFAPGVRRMIYTTNAVEALHRSLRKIINTRGSFRNDEAALNLLFLAIKNLDLRWRPPVQWTAAMGQFAIQFGERFPGRSEHPTSRHRRLSLGPHFRHQALAPPGAPAARRWAWPLRRGQAKWLTVPLMPRSRCTQTQSHLYRNPLHTFPRSGPTRHFFVFCCSKFFSRSNPACASLSPAPAAFLYHSRACL